MAVYVLRFDQPLGDPSRPYASARYYVGYADDGVVHQRILAHWHGQGAAITKYLRGQGIGFRVVNVLWGLTQKDERRIKRSGHYHRLDARRRRRPYIPPRTDRAPRRRR